MLWHSQMKRRGGAVIYVPHRWWCSLPAKDGVVREALRHGWWYISRRGSFGGGRRPHDIRHRGYRCSGGRSPQPRGWGRKPHTRGWCSNGWCLGGHRNRFSGGWPVKRKFRGCCFLRHGCRCSPATWLGVDTIARLRLRCLRCRSSPATWLGVCGHRRILILQCAIAATMKSACLINCCG